MHETGLPGRRRKGEMESIHGEGSAVIDRAREIAEKKRIKGG